MFKKLLRLYEMVKIINSAQDVKTISSYNIYNLIL